MIYECLIAPSESPSTLLDIKRALLTYDKVKLVDPADRDVMPSNTYMSTIIGLPIIGINVGAVRPMGKVIGYDDFYEKTVEKCSTAIKQGLIEIISTYNIPETKGNLTIGGIPTGGYPLNTKFVYWLYRSMAQNHDFLNKAIINNKANLLKSRHLSGNLALKGIGDGSINNIPALPFLVDENLSKNELESLTQIARARIASMIKYAGFCEMKELVPIFSSSVYGEIISTLLNNAQHVLTDIEDDKYWVRRNRILQLCHEEFLDENKLNALTINEVMKLRTKAWGKQAKSREGLFSSISEIALQCENQDIFHDKSIEIVEKYRKESEDLINERKDMHFKIKCDLGKATLGGGTAFIGLLSQLSSPLASMGLTLAAGGMWAFDISKEYVPYFKIIKEQRARNASWCGLWNT